MISAAFRSRGAALPPPRPAHRRRVAELRGHRRVKRRAWLEVREARSALRDLELPVADEQQAAQPRGRVERLGSLERSRSENFNAARKERGGLQWKQSSTLALADLYRSPTIQTPFVLKPSHRGAKSAGAGLSQQHRLHWGKESDNVDAKALPRPINRRRHQIQTKKTCE